MKSRYTEDQISIILSALKFSAERHRKQRRKDVEATPYINHPIEVAELLWRDGGVRDIDVIIAALLHDIVEDTTTDPNEIKSQFGEKTLSIILEVSDDKRLPKRERKRLQIVHAPHLSAEAKKVKLADKICNVKDVTSSPPKGWSTTRKIEYLDWTEKVVAGLRGDNPRLEDVYDRVLNEGRHAIG